MADNWVEKMELRGEDSLEAGETALERPKDCPLPLLVQEEVGILEEMRNGQLCVHIQCLPCRGRVALMVQEEGDTSEVRKKSLRLVRAGADGLVGATKE